MRAGSLCNRRHSLTLIGLCASLLLPPALRAQSSGVVSGVVTDSAGAAVFGAEVSTAEGANRSLTDEHGVFYLSGVQSGVTAISIRRMGFAPYSTTVTLNQSDPRLEDLHIVLAPLPTVLTPVLVSSVKMNYHGRLAGYYQRLEKRSGGYFITRDQIDRENPRTLSQLLLHVPGITPYKGRAGSQGIRMRGRLCWPLVWIDGTPMPAGEVDLDAFYPQTIHGIELYLGSTTAPTRFILGRSDNSCGTIVLWSRGPDTDPIRMMPKSAVDLAALVASLAIFTADQVDAPASPELGDIHPGYPESLFAAGVDGSVIAEFVVDESGRVESQTFGIVASSNPLFSEAVREAVLGAVFTPAKRKGAPVRQLIQQPFRFVARRG
ncbi:MAG TPA: TonB family protein [Gemmatimonadaceae bacterium]|nr:TonB family protein [Gemmatimonadaceae bacterium]